MSLVDAAQQLTIYIGFFLLITGFVGNSINIIVFASVRSYRQNPCTFCFLVEAVNNLLYLTLLLTSRIASTGFGIDATRTSEFWCKTRSFFINFCIPSSLGCICLAAIDQLFVTSRNIRIRQLSQLKYTHRSLLILIIFWFVYAIVFGPVSDSISPITHSCMSNSSGLEVYAFMAVIVIYCFIPVSIISITGYFTYRNIRQTVALREQNADRQLVKMVLVQGIVVVISIIPYAIIIFYDYMTSEMDKTPARQEIEYFITIAIILLSYVYYTV